MEKARSGWKRRYKGKLLSSWVHLLVLVLRHVLSEDLSKSSLFEVRCG